MEKFSVPIERGLNIRVQSEDAETQKIYQKNRREVDKESEILAVDPCVYGTQQNKSFCCNFHPPKNLFEHARRRGDVNRILTHKEGKEWASCPSLHWCGTRVKKALEPKGSVLGAVRVPLRQLSRQDSQKLSHGLNPLSIADFPGLPVISAKSAFVFSW